MKIYTNELGHMTNMAAMPMLKVKTCFSQKQLSHLEPSSYESLRENGNENLYK